MAIITDNEIKNFNEQQLSFKVSSASCFVTPHHTIYLMQLYCSGTMIHKSYILVAELCYYNSSNAISQTLP